MDATLPGGSRLHAVIPDVTRRHLAVNVRKFVAPAASLDDLVRPGTLPAAAARFLDSAVAAGLNILVSGGTQIGKTTPLSAFLREDARVRSELEAPALPAVRSPAPAEG